MIAVNSRTVYLNLIINRLYAYQFCTAETKATSNWQGKTSRRHNTLALGYVRTLTLMGGVLRVSLSLRKSGDCELTGTNSAIHIMFVSTC